MNIKKDRTDLSDWIIHFVHDRSNDQRPEWIIEPCGYGFGETGEEVFDEYQLAIEREAENMNFEIHESDELTAFQVLKLILSMGHIRAGFSYRNQNKTIYGHRPAICFTEMPLHALIQYSKNRNKNQLTSSYAIAFPRKELFKAGARNVIYGLSGPHIEAVEGDEYFDEWHRSLSKKCGLSLNEQYRYVYTNLSGEKVTDWTHEREWRLPCEYGDYQKVGLNFLLDEEESNPITEFSEIVVIVDTNEESSALLRDLAQYYHGDLFNYSCKMVERIKIISLEQLAAIEESDLSKVSIDNIDYQVFKKHNVVSSTEEDRNQVKLFLQEAIEFANQKHLEEWNSWAEKGLTKESNGDYLDECAYVYVVLDNPTDCYSNALIDLGYAQPNGNWGVIIREIKSPLTQSRTIKEFYCQQIIQKLSELTGESFSIFTYLN